MSEGLRERIEHTDSEQMVSAYAGDLREVIAEERESYKKTLKAIQWELAHIVPEARSAGKLTLAIVEATIEKALADIGSA